MPTDVELVKHSKYLEEEYPVGVNFTNRLRTGQSVQSVTVTAEDVNGGNVSSSILGSTSVVSPIVTVLLKQNGGSRGQLYYVRIVALTQADRLELLIALE